MESDKKGKNWVFVDGTKYNLNMISRFSVEEKSDVFFVVAFSREGDEIFHSPYMSAESARLAIEYFLHKK